MYVITTYNPFANHLNYFSFLLFILFKIYDAMATSST